MYPPARGYTFAGRKSNRKQMREFFKNNSVYPEAIFNTASEVILSFDRSGYFEDQFKDTENAKVSFFETICKSLLTKFIKGEDLSWEADEFHTLVIEASVVYGLVELENEGLVYVFDDVVVLKEKGEF